MPGSQPDALLGESGNHKQTRGRCHEAVYAFRLKFLLCAYPFSTLLYFGIMHLCLALNLLHFLPDLGALYALRCAPIFYEIHHKGQWNKAVDALGWALNDHFKVSIVLLLSTLLDKTFSWNVHFAPILFNIIFHQAKGTVPSSKKVLRIKRYKSIELPCLAWGGKENRRFDPFLRKKLKLWKR